MAVLVRSDAAEALGVVMFAEAAPHLIAALADPPPSLRFWAAYALGRVADPSALPALRRLAETDDAVVEEWGSIREEALQAIEWIEFVGEA